MRRPLVLGERSKEAIRAKYGEEDRTVPLSNVEIACATFVWLTMPQPDDIEVPFANTGKNNEDGLPFVDILPTERFLECYPDLGYKNPVSLRTFLNKMSEGDHPILIKAGATKNPTYQVIPELYSVIRSEMVASLSMPHFSLAEIRGELKDNPEDLATVFSLYGKMIEVDFVRDIKAMIGDLHLPEIAQKKEEELKEKDRTKEGDDGREAATIGAVEKSLDDYLVVNKIINRLLNDETFLRLIVGKTREKYGADGLRLLLGLNLSNHGV